jgi:excisionase family DNA binding protein
MYTTLKLARDLGVTDDTVLNWVKSEKLKATLCGGIYRIEESDVDDFVSRNPRYAKKWDETKDSIERIDGVFKKQQMVMAAYGAMLRNFEELIRTNEDFRKYVAQIVHEAEGES